MELDFRREVESANRIRELFEDDPSVRSTDDSSSSCPPDASSRWSSSAAPNPTTSRRSTDAGIQTRDLMMRLMRVFNRMILAYGFFHADPHPGQHLRQSRRERKTDLHAVGFRPRQRAAQRVWHGHLRADVLDDDVQRVSNAAGVSRARLRHQTSDDNTLLYIRAANDLSIRHRLVPGRVHRGDDRRDVRRGA